MFRIRGILSGKEINTGSEVFYWNKKWVREMTKSEMYTTKEQAIKELPIAENTTAVLFMCTNTHSIILSTVEII